MRSIFAIPLFLPSLLLAQEPPQPKVVSGSFGFDFTTQYFFRGLVQENQGVIFQPYFDLGYGLYEGDGELKALDLKFGTWNSLHSETSTANGGGDWYESDFFVRLEAQIGERLTGGFGYEVFSTPNNTPSFSKNASPVEEIQFTFAYDDKGQWGDALPSGLQPTFLVAFEVDGQRDTVTGGHAGVYAECGIEPSAVLGQLGDSDVTMSLPATVGFSLRDYYERTVGGGNDDFFGYLKFGAELGMAMKFLPARMGPWEMHAGLHCIVLGDNQESRNSGDLAELIFAFGCSTTF